MLAALIVRKSEAVGKDLVAQVAQLVDARSRSNNVQLADGGEGVDRAGVQTFQKASALCCSAGILYVSIFVADLLVGHFFVFHAASLASILVWSHD